MCVRAYHERVLLSRVGEKERGNLFIRSVQWEEIESKKDLFFERTIAAVRAHDMYLTPTNVDRG